MQGRWTRKTEKRMLEAFLMVSALAILALLVKLSLEADGDELVINEVCSSNFSVAQDEEGRYPDYVELYNPTLEDIRLDGYSLSDDEKNLEKHSLEGEVVPAGGYYVAWLPESEGDEADNTALRISREGESLFLSGPEGVLDSVYVPQIRYNRSYGRIEDGGNAWAQMAPTAGAANDGAELFLAEHSEKPDFSVESGFYPEPFEVELSASVGETIYYTLDGSIPDANSLRYEGPIWVTDASEQENVYSARTDLSPTRDYTPSFKVDKATVIRAISYNELRNTVSEVVTRVYFVGYHEREEYEGLAVMSLVMDPEDLFHPEYGIYGNGNALEDFREMAGEESSYQDEEGNLHYLYMASNAFFEGKEWEREAAVTYFNSGHEYGFEQQLGVRIAGNSTRATPQKAFSLYAREIYDGNAGIGQDFFGGLAYSSVKLRNGGNNNDREKIRDAFLAALAEGRAVGIQRSEPCVLFLNGEFWGIYNLRERYTEEYLANHYGVSQDNVWLIKAGNGSVGGEQAYDAYQWLLELVSVCDLSYDDVYAMVGESVDMQSLIDFLAINLYLDNRDIHFGQNTALWRAASDDGSEYGDGKWRFLLYDLDMTLHEDSNDLSNIDNQLEGNALLADPFVQSFLANAVFRKELALTLLELAETAYEYERVREELSEWQEVYREMMVNNHRRFFDADFSAEDFDYYIEEIDAFFRERGTYIEAFVEASGWLN